MECMGKVLSDHTNSDGIQVLLTTVGAGCKHSYSMKNTELAQK